MNYLSVCSGIEAASVAWAPLGWRPVAFSEIEPFPCAVLAHHYPDVPNWGDMTKFKEWPDANVDLLCGGTPCQSFSVAGLRKGLDDPRGNLMLTFLAIAARYRPRWLVWENVPGVLSSDKGRDFGSFLGGLGQLGYGWAYRVLDAQYFGLAQRRQRVFVVGCLGDWRRAAAVLLERQGLRGDPAPSRRAGEKVAARALCSSDGGIDREDRHTLVTAYGGNRTGGPIEVAPALLAQPGSGYKGDFESETFIAQAFKASHFTRGKDGAPSDLAPPLSADADRGDQDTLIAFDTTQITHRENRSNPKPGDPCHQLSAGAHPPAIAIRTANTNANGHGVAEDVAHTLDQAQGQAIAFHGSQDPDVSGDITHPVGRNQGQETCVAFQDRFRGDDGRGYDRPPPMSVELAGSLETVKPWNVATTMQVRRLTPRECERLQGFPDGHTAIPWRGKPADQCPDGPRYRALGNSWAVPCAQWIGRRIVEVDAL